MTTVNSESEREHQVTPVELFFDLVFVFAITQVTKQLAHDPTWHGVLRGMLVLAALWWAWTTYASLSSAMDVDEGGVRLANRARGLGRAARPEHPDRPRRVDRRDRHGCRVRLDDGRDRGGSARDRGGHGAVVALLRRGGDLRARAAVAGNRPRPRAA